LGAEGGEGERVVTFREADAVFVGEERRVTIDGQGSAQGFEEEQLPKGGSDQVGAANHLGDAELGVVDGAGQLVAGEAVFSPNKEIAEIAAASGALQAEADVGESKNAPVGHAEAPVGREPRGIERRERGVGGRAPGDRVERLVVDRGGRGGGAFSGRRAFVGSGESPGEIPAGAIAGKNEAGGVEASQGGLVAIKARGLDYDRLLPAKAEPGEVFEGGGGEFGAAARGIEVVDTHKEASSGGSGAGGGEREGARVTEVQSTGGRRSEAADIGQRSWKRGAGSGAHGLSGGTDEAVVARLAQERKRSG
jgi:hypothetical protein